MFYKCINCNHVFEDGEEQRWTESRGEFWGSPCCEEMSGCPVCGCGFEEVKPCKLCGGYSSEMTGEYCSECCNDLKKKFRSLIDTNFIKEEIEALSEIFEGESIW